ncbi:carbohydrate ABC transporter permease [Streptomyces sp. NBC_00257]|jgi:multiple sugar transport system permease protein|uniref:Carbohydrate ABC transporter permease n=1 Tax=Streptomyces sanglieri TaxID=193460 RepID=A0ABW2WUA2_9ACTN|nr:MULTISPECIES: carbohydrate ABC transporter permease [Streptomyces]WSG55027.1 carbohydrate ABC transporter permease [Streptomyces sp. NBC_01732]WSW03715.1 carbohydrate ABC transporter permease [Streptomyces sp. NBC_01005]WSX05744.1 carbohydrate ABC transporter permease [Streptomyces sp. NBC_00987]WTB58732.1 carbohydrate ABC transporter permease [Streptomyces sp. NBC_00826]WTC93219.1 carbohydrate ABC transporter permease [Streptomyces sp. NBC_01650]WTH88391.1 carbohydrate ABC transporter per
MNAPTETALGLTESRSPGGRILKAVTYLLVLIVFAGPLLALLVSAFSHVKDPTQLSVIPSGATLDNFRIAFDQGVLAYLLNSFFVVGFGLLLQVAVSVLAGYALARKRFPGMTLVLVAILATLMLPEEILALPLSVILSDLPVVHFNLIGTLAGMIVPLGAWGFSILVMTEFMKDVPRELEEAARIDGAGDLRIFAQIILPMCKPALGVIGVFGFTMIWDQYLLPLLVSTDSSSYTLPLALRTLRIDPAVTPGVVMAASLLALLPSVIVFLFFQRSFVHGLSSGALKG